MQESHEGCHVQRLLSSRTFEGRQHVLRELDEAAWTPRQHFTCLRLCQLVDAVAGKARQSINITGAQLTDATAVGRTTHDLVVDAKYIHDIKAKQCDVRCSQHIAAGVEHDVWQFDAWW